MRSPKTVLTVAAKKLQNRLIETSCLSDLKFSVLFSPVVFSSGYCKVFTTDFFTQTAVPVHCITKPKVNMKSRNFAIAKAIEDTEFYRFLKAGIRTENFVQFSTHKL